MGKKSKRSKPSLAEEAHCSSSRCQNDEMNQTQMIDLGGDNPPYVVPSVRAAATTECGYEICYRDNRAGRPWMVESPDPETGKIERGSVGELTFRLVPIKVTEVPNIPPPRNMVKAGDITCDMGMNKEEMVATLLNGSCSVKLQPDVWEWVLRAMDLGFLGSNCFTNLAQSIRAALIFAISM